MLKGKRAVASLENWWSLEIGMGFESSDFRNEFIEETGYGN